jgi:diguanylate cyclase (GGDEF)-like protein/PAS domain S-box-containing protein
MLADTRNNSTDSGANEKGIRARVQTAVVDTLYRHILLLQLANIFIGVMAANILRDYLPLTPVMTWLLAMLGVSFVRLYLLRRYRRDPLREQHIDKWLRYFLFGSFLSGLLLAFTAGSLLYAPDLTLVFMLMLIVVGMLAGAVSSLSIDLGAFRLYFLSLSIPFVVVMSSIGFQDGPHRDLYFSIALMLMVYSVVMYFFGINIHRNTLEGIHQRFENEAMAEKLAAEIEKREEAQEELMLSERIISNIREGIVVTDRYNRIIRINDTFSRITGYLPEDVIGKSPRILNSGKQDHNFYQKLWASLNHFGEWEGEIWNRRKNGEIYPEWLSISVIRGSDGEVSNYVGWFRDITERKREEERLSYLAHYDMLTGLPNRKMFMEKLDVALADCSERGELLAILFVDLNMFKQVNDNFGHDIGDILLREVAMRLKSVLRPEDMVARLGGDEFIIMLRNLHHGGDVEVIAEKLLDIAGNDFEINGRRCEIGFAIGISLAPLDAVERKELLRCADRAMYQAKQDRGRSRWCMYSSEDDNQTVA